MTRGVRAGTVGLVAALLGCSEAEPVNYARGQSIPIGSGSFKVQRVEVDQLSDRLGLAVFIRVDLPTQAMNDDNAEIMKEVLDAPVVDTLGQRYDPVGMMLEQVYAFRRHGTSDSGSFDQAMGEIQSMNEALASGNIPPAWKSWIVQYLVPADVGPLRLVVKNPQPQDQQAERIAVAIR